MTYYRRSGRISFAVFVISTLIFFATDAYNAPALVFSLTALLMWFHFRLALLELRQREMSRHMARAAEILKKRL